MADEVFERRWVRTPSGPHVAYAVGGEEGLPALALLPSWMSNLDVLLRQVHVRRLVDSLAKRMRVVLVDRRGTGLSDRFEPGWTPHLEDWTEDVLAVLDQEGIGSAALFVAGLGSLTGFHAAATAPERISHLILWNSTPCLAGAGDLPVGKSEAERREFLEDIEDWWGTSDDRVLVDCDEHQARQVDTTDFAWVQRNGVSRGSARAILR